MRLARQASRGGHRLRAAAIYASVLLLATTTGCTRPKATLPTPLPSGAWPTYLETQRRNPFASEPVPDTPRVAWRSDAGDGVVSPPVLDGPMLFVPATNRSMLALSAATGEAYWTRTLPGAPTGGAVEGGGLLFMATEGGAGGTVTALPLAGGRPFWTRDAPYAPHPPLLLGNAVLVAAETGEILALAGSDGSVLWRARLPAGLTTTPVALPNGELALAAANDSVYVLEAGDHDIAARAPLGSRVTAEPTLLGDTLVLPLEGGDIAALRVPDLTPLWRAQTGATLLATVQPARDGSLYALNTHAEVWRVDPATGQARRLAALGGAARGALTVTLGGLLVGRLDGTLFLLGFDGATRWRTGLGAAIVAPPVVRAGEVWVPLLSGKIVKLR